MPLLNEGKVNNKFFKCWQPCLREQQRLLWKCDTGEEKLSGRNTCFFFAGLCEVSRDSCLLGVVSSFCLPNVQKPFFGVNG